MPNTIKSFLVNIKERKRKYIIIDKNSYNDYKKAICFLINIEPVKGIVNIKDKTLILILKKNYILGR